VCFLLGIAWALSLFGFPGELILKDGNPRQGAFRTLI
jgi:hypothetical protein